jgi:hypothetical protein
MIQLLQDVLASHWWIWGFLILQALFLVPKIGVLTDKDHRDRWTGRAPHWINRLYNGSMRAFAKFWHNYEVHGIENVSGGNCLLVGYHSRPTFDGSYAAAFVDPVIFISPIFYAFPGSEIFYSNLKCVPTHQDGKSSEEVFIDSVVQGDSPVMLFPGGQFECFKSLGDKYKLHWKDLPGYARILYKEPERPGKQTKIVPFFTNNCEDMFYSPDWWYDYSGKSVMRDFKELSKGNMLVLPFLLPKTIWGLGFFLLPRPVKLDLYFGEPLCANENEPAVEFAARVQEATQKLIDSVRSKHNFAAEDRNLGSMFLRNPIYFLYSFGQNVILFSIIFLLIFTVVPISQVYFFLRKKLFRRRGHHESKDQSKEKHE